MADEVPTQDIRPIRRGYHARRHFYGSQLVTFVATTPDCWSSTAQFLPRRDTGRLFRKCCPQALRGGSGGVTSTEAFPLVQQKAGTDPGSQHPCIAVTPDGYTNHRQNIGGSIHLRHGVWVRPDIAVKGGELTGKHGGYAYVSRRLPGVGEPNCPAGKSESSPISDATQLHLYTAEAER